MGVTMPDAGEETAGINNAPAEVNPRAPTSHFISAEQDSHAG